VQLDLPPGAHPDQTAVVVTNRATSTFRGDADPVPVGIRASIGTRSLFRTVRPHRPRTRHAPTRTRERAPLPAALRVRIKSLADAGDRTFVADQLLTTGITKTVSFWDPDVQ
jgi:hypothetical protein